MGLSDFVKKAATIAEREVEQGVDKLRQKLEGPVTTERHRYGSSFEPTEGNKLKWFIDGKDYFYALSEALEHATRTIAIIGWWVSPELFLRRPPNDNREWRLDRTLGRATKRGVKVYGVVYDDVAFLSSNDSAHTVSALEKVNPEMIKIMRHPEHIDFTKILDIKDELYWSHHDKAVIIDDEVVFWGGLDSCFGRWDYNAHPLADLHARIRDELWLGQDYNDARIMDFSHVDKWKYNMLNRTESPRMPWHDVSMTATGPLVHSFSAHFVERWNFVKRNKYALDPRFERLPPYFGNTPTTADLLGKRFADKLHLSQPPQSNANTGVSAQLCRSAAKWSQGIEREKSIQNAYIDLITHATHFIYIENQFFITATGKHLDPKNPIKNQIGKALVDRILKAARAGQKFKVIVFMPAVPGFAAVKPGEESAGTKAIMDYQYISICRGGHSIMESIYKAGFNPNEYISFFNLRSFDRIALTQEIIDQQRKSGVDAVKADIALDLDLNGVDSIKTGSITVAAAPTGDNLDAVAHQKKKERHVKDANLESLFAWGRKDDSRDKHQKLSKVLSGFEGAIKDPKVSESVAQHGMMTGQNVYDQTWQGKDQDAVKNFVSEELYIHSKLMIIDDRVVICGSANLNDRSQQGDRDSEVAVVIEDPPVHPARINGTQWNVSPFAASLRRRLFREHLGLLPPDHYDNITSNSHPLPAENQYDWNSNEDRLVEDPLSPEFWNILSTTAQRNTEIFRNIFHSVPDDGVRNIQQYDSFVTDTKVGHVADYSMPLEYVVRSLSNIRGHVVNMPLHYLEQEKLIAGGFNVNVNVVTEDIYT